MFHCIEFAYVGESKEICLLGYSRSSWRLTKVEVDLKWLKWMPSRLSLSSSYLHALQANPRPIVDILAESQN